MDATSVASASTPLPAYGEITNPFGGANWTLKISISAGSPAASLSGVPFVYQFVGLGIQDQAKNVTPGDYVNGPTVSVTNSGTMTLANPSGPFDNYALYGGSAAAAGYPQTSGTSVQSMYNGGNGGTVSFIHAGAITVSGATTSQGVGAPYYPYLGAIDAYSAGGNGAGAKNNDTDWAGNGGNGGAINVTTSAGSQIILQGTGSTGAQINGITALSLGGAPGCRCSGDVANLYGYSGIGGNITVDHSGSISSTAGNSIGIVAVSIGGDGGLNTGHGVGANPGTSGSGGTVGVTLESGASINLTNGSGIGILAASSVGLSVNSPYGNSIAGGPITGGPVTVTINQGASIASTGNGTFDIGIAAISTGSPDILQPFGQSNVTPNGSGYSGSVTVTNNGSIITSGQLAVGIAALSLGGAGVFTGANPGDSYLGNAGSLPINATGGSVTVTNGGTISTDGGSSFGILAASNGAGGLINVLSNATSSGGVFIGGQNASNNGNGGPVQVNNSGMIATGDTNGGGKVAIGILAQSIGGGGGSAGGSGAAALVGDSGGSGGDGGSVTVSNTGTIATLNDGAIGILAQSIGGGGGNGANAAGIFVATGGAGGSGGKGDTVTVTLGGPGGVSTAGDFAAGVIAQSVGGGGGNGGYAKSVGPFVSAAVGGTGGNGGNGGAVNFTNGTQVITTGQQSLGILAQSIGGGGGNGGAANAHSVGASFSASIALGGSGGGGGSGGPVTLNNNFNIATLGPDSIGLVVQSIGGGGGNGGSALAKALAIASDPEIPTISFSTSLGGSAGSGGSGGTVTINNAGSTVATGNGAHGVLAQSIGGGGGNGGDSTAGSSAIEGASVTVKLAVALGGSGGGGGNGGTVTVTNGSYAQCSGCVSYTSTGGQNAAGIAAQSIGGGGGASTAGQASTGSPNLGGTTGTAVGFSVALGASGGVGGTGGSVSVTNQAGNIITTAGSGSPGILAQSIGGGGGFAGGGSAAGSEDNLDINVAVGGNAGSGSVGGNVTVTNAGTIKTSGGDSVGILVQSIGGGGGVAGSTDASASISATTQGEDIANIPSSNSYSANVAVGGKGGGGGNGGTISLTNSGAITTSGERAYGIEAQSIGGGGGNGGSATSSSSPSTNSTYSASVTLGGSGGAAGTGGTVSVTNGGAILTAGYNAHGILAQSIGGGGGAGGDGSVATNTTIGLGAGISGNGSASGNGNTVAVTTNPGGTITTLGDDAASILAQSIGGGGGTATAGCTNSGSAGLLGASASACFGNTSVSASTNGPASFVPRADFNLNVGGGASAAGNGDYVAVAVASNIVTTGARSMGVIAQSIGGGGGYATAAAQAISGTAVAASPGANASTGGLVTVSLAAPWSITTSGAGAWGILAQSIGGGGGFSGDPSLNLIPLASNTLTRNASGNAFANTVTIIVDGNITTSGTNAHGIFAQSIGGSGGIVAGCCQSSTANALAGNTAQFRGESNATYYGDGGAINLTQSAGSTIRTSGSGSVGIIAQSSGNTAAVSSINLTIGGAVIGGTNNGYDLSNGIGAAGILLSGGGASSNPNAVTVQSGGSISTVDGVLGTAITANYGLTNVINAGAITGSINLGSTPGTITNTGLLNTGATVVTSALTNSGTIKVAGAGVIGTTSLTGNFTQTNSGTIAVDVNSSAGQKADLLNVSGSAQIAGLVVPTVTTALLPGAMTIVTASVLGATASAPSALVFNWNLANTGSTLTLAPSSNFTPPGVTLNQSATSLAGYLTTAWNNSDPQFAPVFAYLSQLTSASGYAATLNAFSPQATQAQANALVHAEGTVLGAPMSCPVFVDQGTLLGEDNCVWAKFTGGQTNQYSTADTPGYQVAGTTYRIGAQHEIAPDWYIGGSLAAGLTWATETGGSSGHGQVFDGSLAVKHTIGPWLFAGSFALATGAYQNTRLVSIPALGAFPAVNALLQSDSNLFLAGGRLRAAYDFTFDNWYIRPYGDLDVVYSNVPGFEESGQAGYALNVQGGSKTSVIVSPMVEFGGRYNVDLVTIVRPYAAVGLSASPNSTRTISASFVGAQPGDGTFQSFSKSPSMLGKFAIGVQLYRVGGFEVKAEYNLDAGSAYLAQSGSARVAYHF